VANHEPQDEGGLDGWAVARVGLMVLGGIAAVGLVVQMLPLLVGAAAIAGAGYVGYKLVTSGDDGQEALPEAGAARKALPAGDGGRKRGGAAAERGGSPALDDFERRMRELEAIERQLDAEIESAERGEPRRGR
jgi:hypothetical protein